MQTFLPESDFAASARCLDYKRLGKQRVETYQILKGSWPHHPASKMWVGHRDALMAYGMEMCREWIRRGYKDNCMKYFENHNPEYVMPDWFGLPEFHASHRSNLLRKHPEHYSQFGWEEPDNLPYVWPTTGA